MNPENVIIGLTGSFGSGCSTLRKSLERSHNFRSFKLSEEVRLEAQKGGIKEPKREQLQKTGNELRRDNGNNFLAKKAIEKIEGSDGLRYVIHGFRHPAEVQEFRKYPNFFLVAVDASTKIRWERVKKVYGANEALFDNDDKRDRDEGFYYGQQVLRCVEQADVIFLNEEQYPTAPAIEDGLKNRFDQYLNLMTGEKIRQPTSIETMMTLASSISLQSSCIKRRVGAVLCNKRGFIVSAAYNEVPGKEEDCLTTYRMCYRDYYRDNFKLQIFTKFQHCPLCGEKVEIVNESKILCPSCKKDLVADLFPSDFKVLDKCRALHAEEAVLLQTPSSETDGAVLYTTTFPCMQCAKRIVHTKIERVIFIDPYPNSESVEILNKGNVTAKKFEGIKAQVFYRLYNRRRELIEKEVQGRRET